VPRCGWCLLWLLLPPDNADGTVQVTQTYEDLKPSPNDSQYVPRIYGFKIFKKKGSKYIETKKPAEVTHYSEDQLKKIKGRMEQKKTETKKP
jgi:hypothetical protein